MKKLNLLPLAAALALAVSCEKPMSEVEKNAQIEREVQQRLAAERQAADQQQLAQQQAELAAREQALAAKEAAAAQSTVAVATPRARDEPDEEEREERAVSSSDARTPRSYDTFYRKLEPHGAWRETSDYGFVWQPREAQSRNWRPYTDGRWAYTDAGWTWVSNESHGWATYHYGRWTRLRGVGWVWVPGEEWAPAWVSWRSSDQHVGWAPLPPEARFERRTGIKKWADSYYDIDVDEYVFIPNEEIGAENIERSVMPVERNVTIVNETTNVTNITYNNTTIVNEGPNYEALRGRSRRPLERMRLERQYNVEETETPQASVRGNVLAIMTPVFTARAVQRPRNVGAPIAQVTVERGSATNANQPEAQRARAKMKSEATPPPDAPPKKFQKPAVVEGTPAPSVGSTVAPAPVATATPRTPPTPAISATASPRPAMTAAPTASSPIATPRSVPAATPSPVVKPSISTPTPKPSASVAPAATLTPKPATPASTSTPTPKPLATLAPTATPKPQPKSSPTPFATTPTAPALTTPAPPLVSPTASPLVPRSNVTGTPLIAPPGSAVSPSTGRPLSTATTRPLGTARPGTDPPETFPSDQKAPNGANQEQQRKQREATNAKIRDMAGGLSASPTIAPPATAAPATARGVTPQPTVPTKPATAVVPGAAKLPAETAPNLQGRSRPVLPPAAIAPSIAMSPAPPAAPAVPPLKKPAAAGVSPTPTPTPSPGVKNARKPGSDVDVPDNPNAKPGKTEEP